MGLIYLFIYLPNRLLDLARGGNKNLWPPLLLNKPIIAEDEIGLKIVHMQLYLRENFGDESKKGFL